MITLSRFLVWLVNLILAIVGVLLGLRFILKLFGANSSIEIVNWIYQTSGDILSPFRGIFPTENVNGFVIEFSTLFAMLVYGILGMLAFYLISILTPNKDVKREK